MNRFKNTVFASAIALVSLTAPLSADSLSGVYLSGSNAAMRGDFKTAAKYFQKALEFDQGNPRLMQNGLLSTVAIGDMEQALKYAQSIYSEDGKSQLAALIILVDHIEKNDFDAAKAHLDENDLVFSELIAGLLKGWIQLGQGKMSGVIESFDALKEPQTLELFGQYHKALALAAVGDFETADTILRGDSRGNLRLTRGSLIAHSQILYELDKKAEAIGLLKNALRGGQDKELEDILSGIENGTSQYSYITTAKQGAAEVFFTMATILNDPENPDVSLIYSRLAQKLRPDDAEITLLTAELLREQEQFDLAIESYTLVSQDNPMFLNAEFGRADSLREAGRLDAAIEVLRGLTRSHKSNPRVHMSLGDFLRGAEKFSAARDAYDVAVNMIENPAPNHWFLFYALGISNDRLDNWPRAEMNFRKALTLAPGQSAVLNYLGYSLVERREKLEEAQKMIEDALAAQPDSGAIADSLGWVRYRLGQFEDALEPMELAIQAMPSDPVINDHLGDVYWMVGRKREAEFQWRRAMSFDPEKKDADRIRLKLELGLDRVLENEAKQESKTGDAN